jgi:hypothetical protein
MKTQIFTLAFAMFFLVTVKSFASNPVATSNMNTAVLAEVLYTFENGIDNEETLEIENWMTNENLWEVEAAVHFSAEEVSDEAELEIEEWMTDEQLWEKEGKEVEGKDRMTTFTDDAGNVYLMISFSKAEKEAPLRIERWMVDDRYWRY